MELEIVEGVKKGSKYYIYDDFIYYLDWRKGTVSYLKCTKKGCHARAVLEENIRTKGEHNHLRDGNECEKYRFREKLLAAASSSTLPLKKVYYEVAEKYPNAAVQYPYLSANTRMKRKRRETHPPVVKDLLTLRTYLESEDWAHLGTTKDPPRRFYECLLQARDESEVMVFLSPEISKLLNITKAIFIDGTFKIVPRGLAQQLTTIHAVYLNKVYPAVYAIMSKRTREAYLILLRYVKSIFIHMNPDECMMDFEIAERQAVYEVFPRTAVKGCWFHYSQAVWRKHREMGLFHLCENNPRGRKILQMFMCLSLLPEMNISEGVDYLQELISIENLTASFSEMVEYIRNYWIEQVGPNVISVFDCPKRTNNEVENFHLQIFDQGGKQAHPSVWDFIRIIVEINRNQTLKFLAHENGAGCSQPRIASQMQDKRITQAGANLLSGTYTVGEFLDAVSHSVSSLEKRLRFAASHGLRITVSSPHGLFSEDDADDPDL